MHIITINKENLHKEHICCAISNHKDCKVISKKQWISDRLDDGLVFISVVERAKKEFYLLEDSAHSPIC